MKHDRTQLKGALSSNEETKARPCRNSKQKNLKKFSKTLRRSSRKSKDCNKSLLVMPCDSNETGDGLDRIEKSPVINENALPISECSSQFIPNEESSLVDDIEENDLTIDIKSETEESDAGIKESYPYHESDDHVTDNKNEYFNGVPEQSPKISLTQEPFYESLPNFQFGNQNLKCNVQFNILAKSIRNLLCNEKSYSCILDNDKINIGKSSLDEKFEKFEDGVISCEKLRNGFITEEQSSIFLNENRTRLKCSACPLTFATYFSLLQHFGSHSCQNYSQNNSKALLQDLIAPWSHSPLSHSNSEGKCSSSLNFRNMSFKYECQNENSKSSDCILKVPNPRFQFLKEGVDLSHVKSDNIFSHSVLQKLQEMQYNHDDKSNFGLQSKSRNFLLNEIFHDFNSLNDLLGSKTMKDSPDSLANSHYSKNKHLEFVSSLNTFLRSQQKSGVLHSVSILPQSQADANKKRNSFSSPDILTIVPQLNSKTSLNDDNNMQNLQLKTASGNVVPSTDALNLVLVLNRDSENRAGLYSRNSDKKLDLSIGKPVPLNLKVDAVGAVDPLSICAVTMEEEYKLASEYKMENLKTDNDKNEAERESLSSHLLLKSNKSKDFEKSRNQVIDQEKYLRRKYVCNYCKKRFGWSTDLKRHVILHTGERPFKCKFCSDTFTRKFLLQNHVKKIHADICNAIDLTLM